MVPRNNITRSREVEPGHALLTALVARYHALYENITYGKKRNEHPNVGGTSIRNRNGAPSRKGCVVNRQITKASRK